MSLFLHLADLHLGPVELDQVLDDYKNELVPLRERSNRWQLLQTTLRGLTTYLGESGKNLDAVIMTGDITVNDNEEGFTRFNELMPLLSSCCELPNKVVVLPGNHDVAWNTQPGTDEHYKNYVKHIRDNGYITPLLDGIDFTPDGELKTSPEKHYLLDENRRWLLVPINSSNYSGSIEPISLISDAVWESMAEFLNKEHGLDLDAAKRTLLRMRRHDVARISPGQFEALGQLIASIDQTLRLEGFDPTKVQRIALIHHHLLPVSINEEFKTFESITNLGLLRQFLRAHSFRMVLHGHKHTGHIYQDHIYDVTDDPVSFPHRLLVVSGATIGGLGYQAQHVCTLLDLDPQQYAPTVSITPIPAVPAGTHLDIPPRRARRIGLWPDTDELGSAGADSHLVSGDSVSETYARLMSLFVDRGANAPLHNVICQVKTGQTANELPVGYPDIRSSIQQEPNDWLRDIVKWWQQPNSGPGEHYFTHGNRIRDYRGNVNQLEQVVRVLSAKDESSRAVVMLLDPSQDRPSDMSARFPSFCLVQFVVRNNSEGEKYLDCIAYFRKQELRYWWPVNVAELANLQEHVLGELAGTGSIRGLRQGKLTTVTAIGYAGTTIPRVSIPTIDRLVDEDVNSLWSLAYAVFWDEMPRRAEYRERWLTLFREQIPPENPDPDGLPVATAGISYLIDVIERFSGHHLEPEAETLLSNLRRLYSINNEYLQMTDINLDRHRQWRSQVQELVQRIEVRITRIFA